MPIRFRDQRFHLARASLSLSAHTSAFTGSFSAAVTRTGTIAALAGPATGAFTGSHSFLQNRTGTIGATLSGVTGALTGGRSWLPFTVPEFTQGTASSFSFSAYAPSGAVGAQLAPTAPALPSGVTISGLSYVYNGTGPVASVSGIQLDDIQATEADWIQRSTAAGVMWAHDFRNIWELYRHNGNPNGMDYNPSAPNHPQSGLIARVSDGPTGFCMQRTIQANSNSDNGPTWYRPFAALPADNYTPPTGTALPAERGYAGGPNAAPVWNPITGGYTAGWRDWGWYGNARYQPGGSQPQTTVKWEGTDYYIQMRVKLSAGHSQGTYTGGKFFYFDTVHAGTNQEIIWQTDQRAPGAFSLYTNFGSRSNSSLGSPQGPETAGVTKIQPGGAYDAILYPNYANGFRTPFDEWFTLLFHVIPGIQSDENQDNNIELVPGANNTGLEVWAATGGATTYTKIYEKFDYRFSFDPAPFGWNGLKISGYYNGNIYPVTVTRRFTQIIFSKQFINCPADGYR